MDLVPCGFKDNKLALNNSAFLCPQLAKDPTKTIHLKIKNKIIKATFSKQIERNKIGMSKSLREYLSLDMVNPIKVQPYQPRQDQQTNLSFLKLQIDFQKKKQPNQKMEIDDKVFIQSFIKKELGTYFNQNQVFYFQKQDTILTLTVIQCFLMQLGIKDDKERKLSKAGRLMQDTQIQLTTPPNSGLLLQQGQGQAKNIFRPDFKIQDMGIGGLDEELFNIFRRTFASRRYPSSVIEKFGIKHVKGILLYGPPGTGKTLIARQLAKALGAKNLQIVNGPQIFSKFVGQSEENVRKLFAKAREDQNNLGDASPLHVIVFDQIDAICKQRGVHSGGSQVTDQVVNQLLTNIDGVEALNNILVIGMTNRKDLLDEAILRPGRLQVHIEVGLPTTTGREQILKIHTKNLRKNNLLNSNCKLEQLARLTRNFTGAEIQSLVKSASSYCISRSTNIMDFSKELIIDQSKLSVTMEDFLQSLQEIKPQFGTDEQKFNSFYRGSIINYGQNFDEITNKLKEVSYMGPTMQLKTVIIQGKPGTGKTLFAINYVKHCTYPYIKIISPDNFVGYNDTLKINTINKIFQDAYKCTYACIVIDDLERLIDYSPIGRRFNNSLLQTLLVLISKVPPKTECKLLLIATTSSFYNLEQLGLSSSFDTMIEVKPLKQQSITNILIQKYQIKESQAKSISKVMKSCTIKNLIEVGDLVEKDKRNNPTEWQFYWQNLVQNPTEIQDI